jgi:hypothetical protein
MRALTPFHRPPRRQVRPRRPLFELFVSLGRSRLGVFVIKHALRIGLEHGGQRWVLMIGRVP